MNGRGLTQILAFFLEFVIPVVAVIGYPLALRSFGGSLVDACRDQHKNYKFFKSRLRGTYLTISLVYSAPFILTFIWIFYNTPTHSEMDFYTFVMLVIRSMSGLYCLVFLLYQIPVWIVCTLIYRSLYLGGKFAQWLPGKKPEKATTPEVL